MEDVGKVFKSMNEEKRKRVLGMFDVSKPITDYTEGYIQKSEFVNPFDAYIEKSDKNLFDETEEDVQKSDVFEALESGQSIKVSKSGSEIKVQAETILIPEFTTELIIKKAAADELLKYCGVAPTKEVDYWWTKDLKIDCGYKVYGWDEAYFSENKNSNSGEFAQSTLSAYDAKDKFVNRSENKEQAISREKYNEKVREICNTIVDLEACKFIMQLDDSKIFELSSRQVITFRF